MGKEFIITSEKQYHETMAAIYELMNKGEENLTNAELKSVAAMSNAAEKYEDETLELRPGMK